MPGKVKVTVSISEHLLEEVDDTSRECHLSRSAAFEEALRLWKKKKLEKDLREGYLAMSDENLSTSEERLPVGSEFLDE